MYTELFKKDNPILAGVEIPGSIDSEASGAADLQQLLEDVGNENQVHMHLLEQ
jgi:hypothetical protein